MNGNLDNINEHGIDEGDHPPITPIGINYSKYSSRLTEKQNDLYNLNLSFLYYTTFFQRFCNIHSNVVCSL